MQSNTTIRIVFDVNIWISSLISTQFNERIENIIFSDVNVLCSAALLTELERTAKKSKFSRFFSPQKVDEMIQIIRNRSIVISTHSIVEICRDPKDNYLLALAQDGNADYLITGDDDLLSLKQHGQTSIVKIAEFEANTLARRR